MDYAIQLWVKQASGLAKVVQSRTVILKGPLDQTMIAAVAKARLEAWPVDGKIITDEDTIDLSFIGPHAVFVRVVEIDGAQRVVFQKTLRNCLNAPKSRDKPRH